MSSTAYLVKIGVEGIQKYICATGKLKEMIGGSEIINYVASSDFYQPLLSGLGLEENNEPAPDEKKYIVAQANAGTLLLILFSEGSARDFLFAASQELLARFPGLPFYTALAQFAWSDDSAGRKAYEAARREVVDAISRQRNEAPVPVGAPLLPILRLARLDGLPAVADGDGLVSLPSRTKSSPKMLRRSQEYLHELVPAPAGVRLVWQEDISKLVAGQESKVALICMDGNDLGKLFGRYLQDAGNMILSESLAHLKSLSAAIRHCNETAFAHACGKIAEYERERREREYPGSASESLVMPLRPLVMGGDDITVIARADIALAFIDLFVKKFEETGKSHNLSVGIGMVVMPASYPFARAFPLAEALQDSAKKLTKDKEPGERPSSLDCLVLTEDVENDLQAVRQRLYSGPDGFALTTRPYDLAAQPLAKTMAVGCEVLENLPRSQTRQAWTVCRKGPAAVKPLWSNLKENIARGLGGREGRLMKMERFMEIFPTNFFGGEAGREQTALGDYLELDHLMPAGHEERASLLALMGERQDV